MNEGKRGDLELGTIGRLARLAAERYGDAVAIEDGEVTLGFRALDEAATRAAAAFLALGIEHGERIAIWAPNQWEWIVTALGAQRIGAALVPVNTRYKGEEAAYLLAKSRARALFTAPGFLGADPLGMLRQSGVALPELRTIVAYRSGEARTFAEFLAAGDGVAAEAVAARAAAVRPDDVCDILFTSGTTGHPKGVLSTHAQTLRAFRDWADLTGLRFGDRYLVVVPFFHSFGYKAGWLAALMMGATVLPQPVFDADAVLRRIGRDRVSVLPGPPALYQSLLMRPDLASFDLSSLRLAVTGAAVIPVELIERMRSELRFERVLTGYGLTEATGVSAMTTPEDDAETIATTSGRAIPGVELRVVGAGGEALPPGEPGEVLVRGYGVTRGYFEDPEQTAEAIDPEGWLHTGDIGVLDARGYLRITNRKKDMFIVGGFNAYPAEIEAVLLRHAAVAQAAVVGIPDERLGEVGMAFLVAKAGHAPSEEEIVAFCRERLANYKVPRRVALVSALPMNASGKVLKYKLRELARA